MNAVDGYERAPIHYAAERDVTCIELLVSYHADVNRRDGNDDTALHWAVFKNKPDCVRALLQNGADVDARDYNADTPLSWAAQRGSVEPMRLLLEYNASVDTVNLSGHSPIYRAARLLASGLLDGGDDDGDGGDSDDTCLQLLINASGQFDLRQADGLLPRVLQDDNRMRELLLPLSCNARKLQELCRHALRRQLKRQYVPNAVLALPLPRKLQQYLLMTTAS